jgi:hypothetical protein
VVGAVVAVGLAGAGYAYGRDVELKKLLPSVLPAVREELTTREVERWGRVLSEDPIETVDAPAEGAAAPGETCPFCGASVHADASSCPQCQHPLDLGEQPAAAPDASAQPEQPPEGPPAPGVDPPGKGGTT